MEYSFVIPTLQSTGYFAAHEMSYSWDSYNRAIGRWKISHEELCGEGRICDSHELNEFLNEFSVKENGE